MVSVSEFRARKSLRISYRLKLNGSSAQKSKYAKSKSQANRLKRQIEELEEATRTGVATSTDIKDWISKGWIKQEEAEIAFPGYKETSERKRGTETSRTDYNAILDAYEGYAIDHSKGGADRKSHRNHMSMARQVVSWLESSFPDITAVTQDSIETHLRILKDTYSSWTVCHYLTKLRLLLDQAVELGMIHDNPARSIRLNQPKRATIRTLLTPEQASELLELSLNYRHFINGSLPTVVRLGLYAGLRNEEMCWLKWDAIDWRSRIIEVKQSRCEETEQTWIPKDSEARRIDVKQGCIDYLQKEQSRQKRQGIIGPFVMPGGGGRRKHYYCRPMTQQMPQKAFSNMIRAEGWDESITVYCLRHTYATVALRAGIDLRTLQRRMGYIQSVNATFSPLI